MSSQSTGHFYIWVVKCSSTTTPSSTVSTATTMDPVTMTTTYPPVTSSSEVTSSPGSNTTSQEALQNSVPMRAMPTSVFSLLGGGGGDHSFDAQGWVEVADQRHQRDMQSESSGMDELDTSDIYGHYLGDCYIIFKVDEKCGSSCRKMLDIRC
eukprot:Em0036g9a